MQNGYFWFLMGGLVLAGVVLVVNDASGTVMGLPISHFAQAVVGLLLVLFLGQGLFRGYRLPAVMRDVAIWGIVGLVLVLGYSFRGELGFLSDRVMGELVPGRATTVQTSEGPGVRLRRGVDGQYAALTRINGVDTTTLIDTGASQTTLNFRTAKEVGIDTDQLRFTQEAMTANGIAKFAVTKVESLSIGDIERRNVRVSVAERGKLGVNLLGMNFLNSLSGFEFRDNQLILRN